MHKGGQGEITPPSLNFNPNACTYLLMAIVNDFSKKIFWNENDAKKVQCNFEIAQLDQARSSKIVLLRIIKMIQAIGIFL